jgi:hypothetical protein
MVTDHLERLLKEVRGLFELERILMEGHGLFEVKRGFEGRSWPVRGGTEFD